jgi:outer membrane protein assembly factor BamB
MKPRPLLVALFFIACVGACLRAQVAGVDVGRLEVIRSWPAKEANQGVAVDATHFYVIDDRALGKYEKATGRKVAEWTAPAGSGVIHMNAGIVAEGRLMVAHSNFPSKPDESSLEYFDTTTLRPTGRKVFAHPVGSLTWAVPEGSGWLACFVHYKFNSDTAKSRIVRYDADWKVLAAWAFSPELVARFGSFSSSGGGLGAHGRVWVSGHDAKELYRLMLPEGGGVAKWEGTAAFASSGQAFAWDPSQPAELYSIQRKSREIIVSRLRE